ncbi:MAG: ABC transporter permease subunit [Actinobacteria bacterium]|nr:MAG: ABC transporter permease subunit [Actinomycetota bacterium]
MGIYEQAIRDAAQLLLSGATEVWQIIFLSLKVSGGATLLASLIGIPIGYALGISRFAGRAALLILVNTAMGFPPVVVGLFVYMALTRYGPLGHLDLLFTPSAMVIAQVILSAPLIAGLTTAAVASVNRDVRIQVRALGASPIQESAAVLVEARRGVFAAVIAGFGAVISEVGAVSIVGGGIQGSTMVMTTAIQAKVSQGDFALAMSWAMVLIGITLVVNVALTTLQNAGVMYER